MQVKRLRALEQGEIVRLGARAGKLIKVCRDLCTFIDSTTTGNLIVRSSWANSGCGDD